MTLKPAAPAAGAPPAAFGTRRPPREHPARGIRRRAGGGRRDRLRCGSRSGRATRRSRCPTRHRRIRSTAGRPGGARIREQSAGPAFRPSPPRGAAGDPTAPPGTSAFAAGLELLLEFSRVSESTKDEPLVRSCLYGRHRTWARGTEFDAVVSTALGSNPMERAGQRFSVGAAVWHLKDFSPEGKAEAARYVRLAPEEVRTRLREKWEGEPWFRQLDTTT